MKFTKTNFLSLLIFFVAQLDGADDAKKHKPSPELKPSKSRSIGNTPNGNTPRSVNNNSQASSAPAVSQLNPTTASQYKLTYNDGISGPASGLHIDLTGAGRDTGDTPDAQTPRTVNSKSGVSKGSKASSRAPSGEYFFEESPRHFVRFGSADVQQELIAFHLKQLEKDDPTKIGELLTTNLQPTTCGLILPDVAAAVITGEPGKKDSREMTLDEQSKLLAVIPLLIKLATGQNGGKEPRELSEAEQRSNFRVFVSAGIAATANDPAGKKGLTAGHKKPFKQKQASMTYAERVRTYPFLRPSELAVYANIAAAESQALAQKQLQTQAKKTDKKYDEKKQKDEKKQRDRK